MHFEVVFVLLFVVATAVAIATRRARLPYTVALVLTGLLLGATELITPPPLTKELLFTVLLPGLLFEAAFHLKPTDLFANKISLSALAIPGMIAVVLLTAALLGSLRMALVPGFPFSAALVFGAAVAATDPIAVVAVFRNLTVPPRLLVLVEGESLFNDGTGVVVFNLVLASVAGAHFTLAGATGEFLRVAGLGAVLGAAIGFTGAHLIRRVDEAVVEITLTVVVAYGTFVFGEQLHVSGVIATVVGGVVCGHYARSGMAPGSRLAVNAFWDYVAFALNSIVFLLIGFEVRPAALLASWKQILLAWLVVLLARTVVIFLSAAALRGTRERLPWSWAAMLSWSGLRGALSMVLVLALPAGFPFRELLVNMTFGVVLLTIVVQGLTAAPMLRLLGISLPASEPALRHRLAHGAALAARHGLAELENVRREASMSPELLVGLEQDLRQRMGAAERTQAELEGRSAPLREELLDEANRRVLLAQREALSAARREGILEAASEQQLLIALDATLIVKPREDP